MAYATGLRILAALCCLTVIGIPLGAVFWWKARQKEKAKEQEQEHLRQMAEAQENNG
ncbi:YccF domain-containing protein [Haloarcula sp. S1CR25-12]|uniref:YccF domain-containing protein n=1 Tax=Haloarcula saliterrae TaxID=2950534 RepID=A0ABU2F9U0_9EURY|nr:hypothetical protein [Haloarcula sp. S1CR25-12]MDS0258610.1 YccF domain-containing protein [Haloarcula sp. S1CR25-12]